MNATSFSPLFDSLQYIHKNPPPSTLCSPEFHKDFQHSLNFLNCYTGSLGTFNSYRREVERLLHWSWTVNHSSLKELTRSHIEAYLHFCQNPPQSWIALKKVPRFIEAEGERMPNSAWRPFVATVRKSLRKAGALPDRAAFSLSQGALQEIFAVLSTFFNFLISEEYLLSNPIALIRQKSKFIQKQAQSKPIRRLSLESWSLVFSVTERLANQAPEKHERTLFIMSLLYGMYLRISEVAASERWTPTMNDFAKDANGYWWFTTVGKGNKERQIAVSESMLAALKRWRLFLNLSPLPAPNDNTPLIPKLRGKGPMRDTAPLRRIVQLCFDLSIEEMRKTDEEEADRLSEATVHWLRHTGISEDVKVRPREHVRDDAGHSSSATTDKYIDVEHKKRYESALGKVIG